VTKGVLPQQAFAYDPYGNLTSDAQTGTGVSALAYDLADHLTGIDPAGTANDTTFTLDALGRFATRTVNGTTDAYDYVDTGETVTRISTGAAVTDSPVSPSGDRFGVKSSGTLDWFIPDLHGDVAGAWDSTESSVVDAIRYDAWGGTIATGSAGGTAVGSGLWTYQGRLDVSPSALGTPLYDMSARFYAPGIAAFTQLDSVMGGAQDPLSMNRFLYAEGNPATLIDPTGHGVDCGIGMSCTAQERQADQKRYREYEARKRARESYRHTGPRTRRGSGDAPQHVPNRRYADTPAISGRADLETAMKNWRDEESHKSGCERMADANPLGNPCNSSPLMQASEDYVREALASQTNTETEIGWWVPGRVGPSCWPVARRADQAVRRRERVGAQTGAAASSRACRVEAGDLNSYQI
jgi:RHS repeat-associated protein